MTGEAVVESSGARRGEDVGQRLAVEVAERDGAFMVETAGD